MSSRIRSSSSSSKSSSSKSSSSKSSSRSSSSSTSSSSTSSSSSRVTGREGVAGWLEPLLEEVRSDEDCKTGGNIHWLDIKYINQIN